MKKCLKCNRENDAAAMFCVECGAQLQNETELPPQTIFNPSFQNTKSDAAAVAAPQKSNKTLFLLLGGLVFVIFSLVGAGVVGGLFLLFNNQSSEIASTNGNSKGNTPKILTNDNSTQAERNEAEPETLFEIPTKPTKQGRFVVSANAGWQISDIEVVANEMFRTKVTGNIDLAEIQSNVSAAGVNDKNSISRRLFPEFPTGALIMRTRYANGEYSNMQAVKGEKTTGLWQNAPDEIGRLEFTVNDNAPEHNSGQFTVDATLISVPK